ncbi:MAG: acyl-CoA dehydrogenase family protein [Jatrophihabitans sp.]
MDFDFDNDLIAVRDLAEKIFTDRAHVERLREIESAGGFDPQLWQMLADAGLLGIALAEEHGGAGMGMLGLAAVLEQQGRRVAPVPLWSVITMGMLPIAQFGSREQQERWLPGLLDGTHIVTGAFDAGPGRSSVVRAEADGDGWRLHGEIPVVAVAEQAAAFVLPVRRPDGTVTALLLPADRKGIAITPVATTDRLAAAAVRLDGVTATLDDTLGDPAVDGTEVLAWVRRRARVAMAAVALGVCAEAVAKAARHTSERVQFGRPLSTNQGVTIRAADAYLDTQNIRLTTHQAALLLDEAREQEAEVAALVAKWWASRGGLRVVLATQHLHGGIGADVDYPIHRYFLWGRQLAFSLGSGAAIEAELGDALAHLPTLR